MAKGLDRRAQPVDNLRGQEALNPVTRSIPSVGSVPTPRVPEATYGQQIAASVSKFAGERLQQIQAARQERSIMDGQIAAMQGASFDSVEMQGDKWALEGYRVVAAQTVASSLLRAQEAEIEAGAYEMDPDSYRETLVGRVEALTSDIHDVRTRQLARDNLMQQMPKLVDAHMRQNISFLEQQNFDALAASVDILSRDKNATGSLVDFATGKSSATAGLSIERRRAAVVQGVINSFTNNNHHAFTHLKAAGFLTTDNLTHSQIEQIEAAQRKYEARFRESFNLEHHAEVARIKTESKYGKLGPIQAVEQLAAADAKFGLRTGAVEGGLIYDMALAGVEVSDGTRGLNIKAAGITGDYDLQARLLQDAVINQESRGNPDAVSDAGATGMMQLMPATAANPGFGVRNIFQVARDLGVPVVGETEGVADNLMRNPEVNVAMGTEYLSAMLERYSGDVERALVAYNWGPDNADKWDGLTDSLPKETKGYLRNILGSITNDLPDPAAEMIAAERNLENARMVAGIAILEAAGPAIATNDEMFTSLNISVDEWRGTRQEIYNKWGAELDAQRINQEQAMMRSVAGKQIKQLNMAGQAQKAIELQANLAAAEVTLNDRRTAFENGTSKLSLDEINAEYMQSVLGAYESSGAELDEGDLGKRARETVIKSAEIAQLALKGQEDAAIIGNAETSGTVGTLPQHLQKRALEAFDRQLKVDMQNYRAENPNIPESMLGAAEREARIKYMTRNNIVDTEVQQYINLAASSLSWIKPNGEPNPDVIVGLHAWTSMYAENPALAYQYVSDPVTRGRMMAAANMVVAEHRDRRSFVDVDLNTTKINSQGESVLADPAAHTFHKVTHQVGLSIASPNSAEETEAAIADAVDAIDNGNITYTTLGGFWNEDVTDAIVPTGTISTINRVLGLGTSDWGDLNSSGNIDRDSVNGQFKWHVKQFLEETLPYMPATSREDAVRMAFDYVRERGAMMGSSYVKPPTSEPSIRAQMFPGTRVDNLAAVNTAIGQWMTNPDVQKRNPILSDIPNNIFWNGVPEYTVTYTRGSYIATIPGHGSVKLPLREIGDLYISNR